jgi:uncharacterized protein (TIGR03435 family)
MNSLDKNLPMTGLWAVTVICLATLGNSATEAQTTAAPGAWTHFEVALVRSSLADDRTKLPQSWGDNTSSVSLHRISLKAVILRAYKLEADQLIGPSWLDDQLFDILATPPAGAPKDQLPLMFQSLVTERFKLTFHRETRAARIYALVVGKSGPKLKEALPADPEWKDGVKRTGTGEETVTTLTGTSKSGFGRYTTTLTANGVTHTDFANMTMGNLAQYLSQPPLLVGLHVIDMTGLKGTYQVTLDFNLLALNGGPTNSTDAADPSGGSIVESLQRLGLSLARRETQVEMFVVDHLDKTAAPN